MKVNTVSVNSYSNYKPQNSLLSNKNKTNPSFKQVFLGKLQAQDIKALYEDGPKIHRFVMDNLPILEKNLKNLVDASVDVYGNLFRTIEVNMVVGNDKKEKVMKYIVDNNESKFRFPKELIDSFNEESQEYTSWMHQEFFMPFRILVDSVGCIEARMAFEKFAKFANPDKYIREMYYNKIPEYASQQKPKKSFFSFLGF